MTSHRNRREFLKVIGKSAGAAACLSLFPPSIQRALALHAATSTGTIEDVGHIVILMLENRSFDHYFGTLRGVRGFGDRHPVPLASGKSVWFQADGERAIPPYHLDSKSTSALRVPDTPHSFSDAQAAWNQGSFGFWPKFKTEYSMGYYRREDIPFQFALAEAFTICDAHHCSVTSGTDPNRIVFFSGSNFSPEMRAKGENSTDAHAEPNNLRCWLTGGALPTPGYAYRGSAFTWPTLPELLERAGVSWKIYQDPNDNWEGLMHGGLAFSSFREAQSGTPLYEKGMRHWSLEQLAADAKSGGLPQVSWVLPPKLWSEHPAPSSPLQGAEFTTRVLDALTANPEVWSQTVLFLSFDENDGYFDHVPPPAPPSYSPDGTLAGKATLDLQGMYFSDPQRKRLHPHDLASGTLRPYGLGPRVPMYVISPWSRGGWVNSQVFDHTSVGQFLERRFGMTVPAISPWHRAVCGDLTSAFDFKTPNEDPFPRLPEVSGSSEVIAKISQLPKPDPPATPESLFQEPGVRRSRALPYELHVGARVRARDSRITLTLHNSGSAGAVLHTYDRLRPDRIPRRYTVEAGKTLEDDWPLAFDDGRYDLWVYGPTGFVREFRGIVQDHGSALIEVSLRYDVRNLSVQMIAANHGRDAAALTLHANVYHPMVPANVSLRPGSREVLTYSVVASHNWYDVTVSALNFHRRFAGRLETGAHGFSDPAV